MASEDEAPNADHPRLPGPGLGGANVEYGEYVTSMELCLCSGTNRPLSIPSVIECLVTFDCLDLHERAIRARLRLNRLVRTRCVGQVHFGCLEAMHGENGPRRVHRIQADALDGPGAIWDGAVR